MKPEKGKWSVAYAGKENQYLSKHTVQEHYQLLQPYEHSCHICGTKMTPIPDFEERLEKGELPCGICGDVIETQGILFWD